jgi:hypothetical protein
MPGILGIARAEGMTGNEAAGAGEEGGEIGGRSGRPHIA